MDLLLDLRAALLLVVAPCVVFLLFLRVVLGVSLDNVSSTAGLSLDTVAATAMGKDTPDRSMPASRVMETTMANISRTRGPRKTRRGISFRPVCPDNLMVWPFSSPTTSQMLHHELSSPFGG